MKLKLFVVAMALGLSSLAQAQDYDLGSLVVPSELFNLSEVHNAPGSFIDTWSFEILADTYLAATFTDLPILQYSSKNIDALSVKLYDGANELISNLSYNIGSTGDQKLGAWQLTAGSYSFKVAGNATGKQGGVYTAFLKTGATETDFTVPVPEPETYAMLLAGLGVLGAVARRRMK